MITEIPKDLWKEFFDNVSRDFENWATHIEIFSDARSHVLSHGLPFHGLTAEGRGEQIRIELLVGHCADCHQSHTVTNPTRVYFEGSGLGPTGLLDIEDDKGSRLVVAFVEPFPILLECVNTEVMNAVGVR